MDTHANTALLIIDMQNDFVSPGGSCVVAGAFATIKAIAALAAFARNKNWPVIHIVRGHAKSGVDAEKQRLHLFTGAGGLTVADSWGAAIVDGLAPEPTDLVVRKWRFSGFFETPLDLILRRLNIKNLVICGTQYPNCIRATAVDGLARDYNVVICREATSAQTPAVAAANIFDLENMGVRCLALADITANA